MKQLIKQMGQIPLKVMCPAANRLMSEWSDENTTVLHVVENAVSQSYTEYYVTVHQGSDWTDGSARILFYHIFPIAGEYSISQSREATLNPDLSGNLTDTVEWE